MKKIISVAAALLLFSSFPLLSAKRSPAKAVTKEITNLLQIQKASLRDNDKIAVVGRLRLVGNEPFTRYVITPPSNFDIDIDEDSVGGRKNISKMQYKIVQASGTIRVRPLRKDDAGKVIVNRYTLIVNDISEYKGEYKE